MINRTKFPLVKIVLSLLLAFMITVSDSTNMLFASPLQQEAGTVNRDANVRAGPGVDYDVITYFTGGTAVEITGKNEDGSWYQLSTGEWIAAWLVDRSSDGEVPVAQSDAEPSVPAEEAPAEEEEAPAEEAPAEEAPAEEAPAEEAPAEEAPAEEEAPAAEEEAPAAPAVSSYNATVSRDGNLRAGPSTLYDVSGSVESGEVITLVGQTPYGNWFITENGDWVSISVISNPPGALPYISVEEQEEASDEEAMDEEASDEEAMDEEAMDEEAMDEEASDEEAMDEEASDEEAMDEMPEPQVTIPAGWTPIVDSERGYSLAMPPGWAELDLRGAQFAQLATTFGQGEAVGGLQDFLATPEGESVGVVAITDIANTFFGGLPTLLNVSVIQGPGATAELLEEWVLQVIDLNPEVFDNVQIDEVSATTINNLPAVMGSGSGSLAPFGINAEASFTAVGLIQKDVIYVLTLATQTANAERYESTFDDIIGTFRPE
ncbi:MAG: SH3 domain-containing protein [Chloroflexota bacterium]